MGCGPSSDSGAVDRSSKRKRPNLQVPAPYRDSTPEIAAAPLHDNRPHVALAACRKPSASLVVAEHSPDNIDVASDEGDDGLPHGVASANCRRQIRRRSLTATGSAAGCSVTSAPHHGVSAVSPSSRPSQSMMCITDGLPSFISTGELDMSSDDTTVVREDEDGPSARVVNSLSSDTLPVSGERRGSAAGSAAQPVLPIQKQIRAPPSQRMQTPDAYSADAAVRVAGGTRIMRRNTTTGSVFGAGHRGEGDRCSASSGRHQRGGPRASMEEPPSPKADRCWPVPQPRNFGGLRSFDSTSAKSRELDVASRGSRRFGPRAFASPQPLHSCPAPEGHERADDDDDVMLMRARCEQWPDAAALSNNCDVTFSLTASPAALGVSTHDDDFADGQLSRGCGIPVSASQLTSDVLAKHTALAHAQRQTEKQRAFRDMRSS